MKQSLSPRSRRGETPGDLPAGVALISKQIFEARRGQLPVGAFSFLYKPGGMLCPCQPVLRPLDQPADAVVCQLISAGVAQHVWGSGNFCFDVVSKSRAQDSASQGWRTFLRNHVPDIAATKATAQN